MTAAIASTGSPGALRLNVWRPAGGHQALERALQHREQAVHQRGRALMPGVELAVLVPEQDQRGVALHALHEHPEDLLDEGDGLEPLQGEIADLEQDLDSGLSTRELLGETGRQRRLPIPLLPIGTDPLEQVLHLTDGERLGQIVVGAVTQSEDRRVDRGVARDEHHRCSRLPRLDRAQQVETREARHLDVGDHEVEGLGGDHAQRLLGGGRLADDAAVGGEGRDQEAKQRRVVVDDEYAQRLGSCRHQRGRGHHCPLFGGGHLVQEVHPLARQHAVVREREPLELLRQRRHDLLGGIRDHRLLGGGHRGGHRGQ